MTRMSLTCAVLILSGPLLLVAQNVPVPRQPDEITGALSRVYKSVNGSELRLHIFNPQTRATPTAVPAIVFFFGGAWTGGTVTQFAPQSQHLADRGMIA